MRSSPARRLVVLDLDGTVAVGDEPVRTYLAAVVERAPEGAAEAVAELAAFLDGGGTSDGATDGYAVVAGIGDRLGLAAQDRRAAYAESRAALHDGRVPVETAAGLLELLEARPADVRCVLVTNAPADGIEPLLERLGVTGLLDGVVGDAGKPAGMPAVLAALLEADGLAGDRLLAVGDVWANDLAPAAAIGATTAYVDRFGRGDGEPDFRAPTFGALVPAIEGWWSRSPS